MTLLLDVPLDANFDPCFTDSVCSIVTEFFGAFNSDVGKLLKGAVTPNLTTDPSFPPDLASDLPRVAAERSGNEVECLVRDPRVEVYASPIVVLVIGQDSVVFEVVGLFIFPMLRDY